MLRLDSNAAMVDPDVLEAQKTALLGRLMIIRGESTIRVMPDTVELSFSLHVREKQYEDLLTKTDQQLNMMKNLIESSGFQSNELRMVKYNVDTEYGNTKRGREIIKEVQGYRCDQAFLIKFPLDLKKLDAILKAMDQSDIKPEFSIKFTLRDNETAKDEALRQATLNAKRKAELIAEASGVTLGRLLTVKYDYANRGFGLDDCTTRISHVGRDYERETRPDSIMIEASADFIWEIES